MSARDRLEVISPAGDIKFYELDPARGVTNIGRHPDNDVVIDSPSVAPFHAVLYHQQKPYQLILIGAAQGVPRTLNTWETLQLDGYSLMVLEAEPSAGPVPPPISPPPALPRVVEPRPAAAASREAELPAAATPAGQPASSLPPGGLIVPRKDEIVMADFSAREFTLEVDQSATCTVALANGGDIVATFLIAVQGLDDRWVSISPPEINLNEGQHGSALITITPPRQPASRAGAHHFGIVVSSPDYPDRVSQTPATLVIQPYFEYAISDISPKQQNIPYTKRAGNAAFSLTNTGNSDLTFQVQAVDDARACQFEFRVRENEAPQARQIEVSLPPETTQTIRFSLVPLRRVFFGFQGVQHPYSVQAIPLGTTLPSRSVLAQAQSLPLIGPFHVAAVLVLLVLLAIFIFRPRINAFGAAPDTVLSSEIMGGKKVSLSWNVSWLAAVTIDQGVGQMKTNVGATDVAPLKTTTYRLSATNLISALIPAFAATREQTVVVDPVEPIVRLSVDRDNVLEGETVTLSWEVLNASEVVLKTNGTPETLPPEQYVGHREVTPKGETTYSIEARNLYTTGAGTVQTRVVNAAKPTATPLPLPVIERFDVPLGPVTAGDTVTLDWSVSGADKVTIEPLGEFPPSGKTIDKPTKTTSYQLIASNGQVEVRSLHELKVNPAPTATPVPGMPKIDVLTATPNEVAIGSADISNILITWAVSGDFTNIELSGGTIGKMSGLTAKGTRIVTAGTKDTTFTLTAQNGANGQLVASQDVTVKVVVPVPVISNLDPPTVVIGSVSSLNLTVNGASFVPGASVRLDGVEMPTTFVDSTQLTASLSASDVATQGKLPVTVFNPAKNGGGASNAVNLIVQNPVPILTALSSYAATVNSSADLVIGLSGSGFVPASKAQWGGAALATTYGDAHDLTAVIPAANTSAAGEYVITIVNPVGGSSGGKTFTVGNPVPIINSLTPASLPVEATALYTDVVVTIKGAGFLASSTVAWNGVFISPVDHVSANELQVTVPGADFKSPGSTAVLVVNPSPVGGPSAPAYFTVNKVSTGVILVALSSNTVSGELATFRATVIYDPGISSLPGSTVTFKADGTTLGFASVVNSLATFSTRFKAGLTNLTAQYSGDNTFAASSPTSSVPYITLQAPSVTTVAATNASTYGDAVNFCASVNAAPPGSNSPVAPSGGNLLFYVGTSLLGAVSYGGGSACSPPISTLAAGAHAIQAQYQGDTNFAASASDPITHQVLRRTPEISLVTDPAPSANYGDTLTLNATVSCSSCSAAGLPSVPNGGTITFSVIPAPSGYPGTVIEPIDSQGRAAHTFANPGPWLNAGNYTLQADFHSGDNNFGDASTTLSFKIEPIAPQEVILSCGRSTTPPSFVYSGAASKPSTPPDLQPPTGGIHFDVTFPGTTDPAVSQDVGFQAGTDPATTPQQSSSVLETTKIVARYVPDASANYTAMSASYIGAGGVAQGSCILYYP